jgi:hypothetical protein
LKINIIQNFVLRINYQKNKSMSNLNLMQLQNSYKQKISKSNKWIILWKIWNKTRENLLKFKEGLNSLRINLNI